MNQKMSKALIWDLGNTLIKADTFCFALEIGITDFLFYPLLDWKNPMKIHEFVFQLLADSEIAPHNAHPRATARGVTLPHIFCQLLAGNISYSHLREKFDYMFEKWKKQKKFTSKRQERLISQTFKIMFDPEKFVRCMKPIKNGINLLYECSQQRDHQGNPLHKLFILSNWDEPSFECLFRAFENDLFKLFDTSNIAISAQFGTLKPQSCIYQKFMQKYKLKPQNCILIDDQIENVLAAQQEGITALLLDNENYDDLKMQLKKLSVL